MVTRAIRKPAPSASDNSWLPRQAASRTAMLSRLRVHQPEPQGRQCGSAGPALVGAAGQARGNGTRSEAAATGACSAAACSPPAAKDNGAAAYHRVDQLGGEDLGASCATAGPRRPATPGRAGRARSRQWRSRRGSSGRRRRSAGRRTRPPRPGRRPGAGRDPGRWRTRPPGSAGIGPWAGSSTWGVRSASRCSAFSTVTLPSWPPQVIY